MRMGIDLSYYDKKQEAVECFIAAYKAMMAKMGAELINCQFVHETGENFVNVKLYLMENEPGVIYRINDKNNRYVVGFYETLKTYYLPGISEGTKVQLFVINVKKELCQKAMEETLQMLNLSVKELFPEVKMIEAKSCYYVFINHEKFEIIRENREYLEKLRVYCYLCTKMQDKKDMVKEEEFHITVDDYEIYETLGERNYFNSIEFEKRIVV